MACPRPLPYVLNGVWPCETTDYTAQVAEQSGTQEQPSTYYMHNAGCQCWQTQMRVIFSLAPPSNAKYGEKEILKCGSLH